MSTLSALEAAEPVELSCIDLTQRYGAAVGIAHAWASVYIHHPDQTALIVTTGDYDDELVAIISTHLPDITLPTGCVWIGDDADPALVDPLVADGTIQPLGTIEDHNWCRYEMYEVVDL